MKNFLSLLTFLFLLVGNCFAQTSSLTLKWNSPEGLKKFAASQYKNDFYQLADHFQPQINPLYCSIATSVIILNTINEDQEIVSQKNLEVVKPKAFGGGNIEFNSYSQLTLLNEKTDQIKDRKIINLQNITHQNENDVKNFDAGLNLTQLANLLKFYQLQVQINYVKKIDKESLEKFRQLLKKTLADNQQFLVVNFNGQVLGLKTNGHISPVAAFDQDSDAVLVMDVAGHKNGWYWVQIKDLYQAMHTKDGKDYRGYLVISS